MRNKRQFCLYCGNGTIKKPEDNILRDFCPSCKSFFYDNPLPVVSAIVDSSRNILLVKRDRRPFKGYWCLPTGFAEAGESIENACLRELEEETGIRGKIVRLLDVDSYKSHFYGDLLFLTFVVEQTGGKLTPGDDSIAAKFCPVEKIPSLAFRPNRHALSVYIKTKRDYWSILDSIDHTSKNSPKPDIAKSALTKRLVNIIAKNKEDIVYSWIGAVATGKSTAEYHKFDQKKLFVIADKIISQIILWLGGLYDINSLKSFYIKLGRERRREGFKISETLSALSLVRKHIWEFAIAQGAWHKNIDLYMIFEMQRRMTIFFDLAIFYLTRGYEEE
jgi:8-oxo-dGTP diphosphatase